jgi:hypothetical protein
LENGPVDAAKRRPIKKDTGILFFCAADPQRMAIGKNRNSGDTILNRNRSIDIAKKMTQISLPCKHPSIA